MHEDKKSSETACLAMSRLAESYKNDKNRLRDIASADVLANLQRYENNLGHFGSLGTLLGHLG